MPKHMIKHKSSFLLIILTIALCIPGFANETKAKSPKSIDETASGIVTNVFKKTNAFFQGDLEVTMSADNSRNKNKNNYTVNALGMKVPKSTAGQENALLGGKDVRQRLLDGNKRYSDAEMTYPDSIAARRAEVAKGQHPFAAIVSCSDSRVPPEIVFDQGLGDLFVVRLAGNVVDDDALGSLEYAVEHLGVRYIMVLGHERCGAIGAAVKGGDTCGHIGCLVMALQPAVDKARLEAGDVVENAVRANVAMAVAQLKSSKPILEDLFKKGELTIEGGRYDLDDGTVTII
jgi:carbonic anhydrase